VLPLVPGYLGFVSGLSGADMAERGARARGAVVAGAGWTPCIGPTLAAILTLTTVGQDASPARGAVLAFAYAVGLGLPFLAVAVALRGGLGALRLLHGRSILVERVGGVMLLAVGVLLVTGLRDRFILQLQPLIGGFRTPL
jgi:cytochrome c-type biogenesis protein